MLPDVNRRRTLWGITRKNYDGQKIKEIINLKNHDGCTTRNCVPIMQRMNGYLDDSRYLVIETSAIFCFLRELADGEYADSENKVLRLYAENIDHGLLTSSMRNVMKVTKSLASQRRLVRAVKPVVKKNRIDTDWESLLTDFMDGLESRMEYVKKLVIPVNLANTPMGAYTDYLDSVGVSLSEDIQLFLKNSGRIFDEDDPDMGIYKDHVMQILDQLEDAQVDALLKKARSGMEARRKRIEKTKAEIEASKIQEEAAAMKECREIVLGLCSMAGKEFRMKRIVSLRHRAKNNADVWVVCAAIAEPRRTGYLKKSGGKYSVASVDSASLFLSVKEAEAAAERFRKSGPNRLAEVSKVELYAYGIGI